MELWRGYPGNAGWLLSGTWQSVMMFTPSRWVLPGDECKVPQIESAPSPFLAAKQIQRLLGIDCCLQVDQSARQTEPSTGIKGASQCW